MIFNIVALGLSTYLIYIYGLETVKQNLNDYVEKEHNAILQKNFALPLNKSDSLKNRIEDIYTEAVYEMKAINEKYSREIDNNRRAFIKQNKILMLLKIKEIEEKQKINLKNRLQQELIIDFSQYM